MNNKVWYNSSEEAYRASNGIKHDRSEFDGNEEFEGACNGQGRYFPSSIWINEVFVTGIPRPCWAWMEVKECVSGASVGCGCTSSYQYGRVFKKE